MNFLSLPNEIIEKIISYLPPESALNAGQVCHRLKEIAKSDIVWHYHCIKDYNVYENEGWNISYFDIYTKVLRQYGFLGWKRLALLPYGGLVHVSWGFGEIEVNIFWPGKTVNEDLTKEILYTLRWNHEKFKIDILCADSSKNFFDKSAKLVQAGKFPLIKCLENDCCHHQKCRDTLNKFRTSSPFQPGFLDHKDAFDVVNLQQGFNCPMLPLELPGPHNLATTPIQLGLYKAMYGSHGVEILLFRINADYPNHLDGLKITGDPNVPAGNISLTIFLNKPVVLNEEDQSSVYSMLESDKTRTEDEYRAVVNAYVNNTELKQPFHLPTEVFDDDTDMPQVCTARFVAQGQIAGTYFTNPQFCRCHFVRFTPDMFGVLWLDLLCFSRFLKIDNVT